MGQSIKYDHFVPKMKFFKELKVRIGTYELRGQEKSRKAKKEHKMQPHHTQTKTISKSPLAPY